MIIPLFVGLVKNKMNIKENLFLFTPNLLKIKILTFFFILFFSVSSFETPEEFTGSEIFGSLAHLRIF